MILRGDCRTLLTLDECATFDCMVVDPPYRAHVHKNATSQSAVRGTRHRELGFEHLTPALRRWTAKVAARVKRWSLIYTDIESAAWWRISLQAAGATYIRTIPWIRWSMPQLSGDRPTTGCELLIVAYGSAGGKKSWNGPGNLIALRHQEEAPPITHLDHKCLRGESKHKAEKPLDQIMDLVSWFTNPGELVFDPMTGSGTVPLACSLLGRRCVGIEQDATWAARATARESGALLSPRDQERLERFRKRPLEISEVRT